MVVLSVLARGGVVVPRLVVAAGKWVVTTVMRMCDVLVMTVTAAVIAAINNIVFKSGCDVPSDTRSLCHPKLLCCGTHH